MRKTLTFNGLDNPSFTSNQLLQQSGKQRLNVEYSLISPGTELFSIRSGKSVQPGYIAVGRGADDKRYFVFPSLPESSACHSNILDFSQGSIFFELPDTVSSQQAGFLRFINIGLHPLTMCPRLPQQVAVIGLGPVGNLAVQSAKLLGCEVVAVDSIAERRELMRKCGQDKVLTPEQFALLKTSFDLVIDTVVLGATILSAIESLKDGGYYSLVGIVKPDTWNGVDLAKAIWERDLHIRSGWEMKFPLTATIDNVNRGLRWLADSAYIIDLLISGIVPAQLTDIKRAYQHLAENPATAFTYLIDWQNFSAD